jgi:hypothetical protein
MRSCRRERACRVMVGSRPHARCPIPNPPVEDLLYGNMALLERARVVGHVVAQKVRPASV